MEREEGPVLKRLQGHVGDRGPPPYIEVNLAQLEETVL